jgi:hypothetical protein
METSNLEAPIASSETWLAFDALRAAASHARNGLADPHLRAQLSVRMVSMYAALDFVEDMLERPTQEAD